MRSAEIKLIYAELFQSPLGRPKCRWEDNVKIDLKEISGRVWAGFIWFSIGTSGGPL
jgi:hypothetical protein